jgi:hypothetical protein
MDFMGGFPTTKKGHDYLFVVDDRLNNMFILMPCKNTVKGKKQQTCSLNRSRCTLGYQGASSQIVMPYFSVPFGLHFGRTWTPC